jgi:hypothetical protein
MYTLLLKCLVDQYLEAFIDVGADRSYLGHDDSDEVLGRVDPIGSVESPSPGKGTH